MDASSAQSEPRSEPEDGINECMQAHSGKEDDPYPSFCKKTSPYDLIFSLGGLFIQACTQLAYLSWIKPYLAGVNKRKTELTIRKDGDDAVGLREVNRDLSQQNAALTQEIIELTQRGDSLEREMRLQKNEFDGMLDAEREKTERHQDKLFDQEETNQALQAEAKTRAKRVESLEGQLRDAQQAREHYRVNYERLQARLAALKIQPGEEVAEAAGSWSKTSLTLLAQISLFCELKSLVEAKYC